MAISYEYANLVEQLQKEGIDYLRLISKPIFISSSDYNNEKVTLNSFINGVDLMSHICCDVGLFKDYVHDYIIHFGLTVPDEFLEGLYKIKTISDVNSFVLTWSDYIKELISNFSFNMPRSLDIPIKGIGSTNNYYFIKSISFSSSKNVSCIVPALSCITDNVDGTELESYDSRYTEYFIKEVTKYSMSLAIKEIYKYMGESLYDDAKLINLVVARLIYAYYLDLFTKWGV